LIDLFRVVITIWLIDSHNDLVLCVKFRLFISKSVFNTTWNVFFFCIYSYLNWKWSHSGIYSSTEKNSYIKSKQNSNANKLFMNNCKMKHLSSIWLRTRALLALVQICTPSLKTVFTSCRSWIRCLDDATPHYNNVTTPIMDNLKRNTTLIHFLTEY
jgi:hypothetical protein